MLVSVPMDIFSKEIDVALFEHQKLNTRSLHKPSIDDETATLIVKTLLSAKNPLAYVGGGVILADAAEELRKFVTHLSLPVAHSLMGKGVLPDDHPMTLGMTGFWGTELINDKCKDADYVIGLGTRFSEADCSSWDPRFTFNFPPTRLIHIDIDPNAIGRNYPGGHWSCRRPQAGFDRAEPCRKEEMLPEGRKNDALVREIAANREAFMKQRAPSSRWRVSDASCNGSWPMYALCFPATPLSLPTWAGTRMA